MPTKKATEKRQRENWQQKIRQRENSATKIKMVGKKATQNYCRCRIFPLPNSLLPIFFPCGFFRCLFSFPLLHTLILCFPTCFPTRLFFVADFSGSPIFPVAVSSIAVFSCLFSVAIFTVAVLS